MGECKDKDVFEQLKPALFYWASHYKGRQFEYWELVNAAWASERWRQVKPEYYFQAIKYAIQDYIRAVTKSRTKQRCEKSGKFCPEQYALNLDYLLPAPEKINDFEQRDFIDNALKGMSRRQRLVMKLKYIEDFTNEEIGRVIGLHSTRISQIHSNIIQFLRYKMAEN